MSGRVRARLDRRRVVDAAIDFIDRHGVADLTMRRLGATLHVEAMALYRHVAGRDELLDAVVEQLVDDLFDSPDLNKASKSWEEYLQRVAHAMRSIAVAHPRSFPLVATRPSEAPWVRPPLRSLRWVEDFLSSLQRFGFDDAACVAAYKVFTSFIVGALLLESAPRGVDRKIPDDGGADTVRESYPLVQRLQGRLAEDLSDREFDDGLDDLIERLRHLRRTGEPY